jgi:hypothetical protein
MATSTDKGKKWVSFNVSFTAPCQFFRGFRLFRPFLIFMVQKPLWSTFSKKNCLQPGGVTVGGVSFSAGAASSGLSYLAGEAKDGFPPQGGRPVILCGKPQVQIRRGGVFLFRWRGGGVASLMVLRAPVPPPVINPPQTLLRAPHSRARRV